MIDQFAAFFVILVAGIVWRFVPGLPSAATTRAVCGSLVVNFFLPALTFSILSTATLRADHIFIPLIGAVCCLVGVGAMFCVLLLFRRKSIAPATKGSLLLAAGWGNVTYLGLPVVISLYGNTAYFVPILYDLLGVTPLLLTLGVVVCSRYGTLTEKEKSNGVTPAKLLRSSLTNMLRLPPLWAAVLGIIVNVTEFPVPMFIGLACATAAKAVVPIMIFVIGVVLTKPGREVVQWVVPVVAIKLLLSPLLAYALVLSLPVATPEAGPIVTEAMMPVMVLTLVFAGKYGLNESLLAQLIAVTTLISFLTIPLLTKLFFG